MVAVGVSLAGRGVWLAAGTAEAVGVQADKNPSKSSTRPQVLSWRKAAFMREFATSDTALLKSGQITEVEIHSLLYNCNITILAQP